MFFLAADFELDTRSDQILENNFCKSPVPRQLVLINFWVSPLSPNETDEKGAASEEAC
jgi:hypothetical protein